MGLKSFLTKAEYETSETPDSYSQVGDSDFYAYSEEIEDVSGLKTALQKERTNAKGKESAMTALETLKTETAEAVEFFKTFNDKKKIDKGEFELIRIEDKKEFERITAENKATSDVAVNKWRDAFKDEHVRNQVQAELSKKQVIPELMPDAVRRFSKAIEYDLNGDQEVKIKFLDKYGLDSGADLSANVAKFKEDNKVYFLPSQAAGSDATGNKSTASSGNTMSEAEFDALPESQKIEKSKEGVSLT